MLFLQFCPSSRRAPVPRFPCKYQERKAPSYKLRRPERRNKYCFSWPSKGSACKSSTSPKAIKGQTVMKTDGGYLAQLTCPTAQAQKRPCWDHHMGGNTLWVLIRTAVIVFYHRTPVLVKCGFTSVKESISVKPQGYFY